MEREVAIVGAACLLPEAATPEEFERNLRAGRHSVRPPPEDRLRPAGIAPGECLPMGCLDRVDLFDHPFFGISKREAEVMDPHQRLALQLVHAAIEDACYAPASLRGARAPVILNVPGGGYAGLYQEAGPLELLGAAPSAMSGRVSYAYDLQGPSLSVDLGCASGLAAVVLAMELLRRGDAPFAIAGAITVWPVPAVRSGDDSREIISPDGVCRAFDAAANGAAAGEGGVVLVLKPLRSALADGDRVQAVVRGGALSHNGYGAASLTAPSEAAQARLLNDAWRDAGVDGRSISYVEAHGSGTRLGDVIEVTALAGALHAAGARRSGCAVGSVKTNIGHLDHAAGLASLLKVVLGLRHRVLYPSLHFSAPNPLIDFGGPVRVSARLAPWEAADGSPLRAGVSAFNLVGGNAHVVVEEAPAPPVQAPADVPHHLVTVSARSGPALGRYLVALADFVERSDHPLLEVAHAMNRGRDDHPFRVAFAVSSRSELVERLRSARVPDAPAPLDPPVVLLFSGDADVGADSPAALCGRLWELHGRCRALGLPEDGLVGSGAGNLALRAIRGELSLPEAVARSADLRISDELDHERLRRALSGFAERGAVLVELGGDGVLSREARRLAPDLAVVALDAGERGLLESLARLYALGVRVDWERHYAGVAVRRIAAPGYPFEPIPCWLSGPRAGPPGAEDGRMTRTERVVAEVWRDVLHADDLRRDSEYFALGGSSVTGLMVLNRLRRELGVELGFADLFEHPTIAGLAARVDAASRAAADEPSPIPRDGPLPLSFGQEQIWFMDQLHGASPLYNIPIDLHFRGPLDEAALRAALCDLVGRHEALRTRFPARDGAPYAEPCDPVVDLPLVDLGALPRDARSAEVVRRFEAEGARGFALQSAPPLRAALLRLGPLEHVLLLTIHHIVFDGWTPVVLNRELSELYRARAEGRAPDLPPLPIQYADFAAWQRSTVSGTRLERGLAYWRDHLAGAPALDLPADRPRPPVQGYAGEWIEFEIGGPVMDRVRAFSRSEGVTTFVTMLAVTAALIHRWTEADDFVVGVPTSGRRHPATQGLIGYFNNMMPLRVGAGGDPPFRELVRRCAGVVVGALDHDEVPFDRIVAAVGPRRDAGRHPLFDVAYNHQNSPTSAWDLGQVTVGTFAPGTIRGVPPHTAKFDLTIGVAEGGEGPAAAYVEYATALFERATAERLAAHFATLLDSVLAAPDLPLSRVRLQSEALERRLVRGLNDTGRDWSDDALAWQLVERQAALRPDAPAVVDGGRTWTYAALDRRANGLARRLVAAGVCADRAVPVVAERGFDMVAAWLAVQKAGGAFVPVDPALPAARIAGMLAEVDSPVALARSAFAALVPAGGAIVPLDEGEADDADEAPPRRAGPANLAYVAYTSGSTGRPHGAENVHRGFANLVRWFAEAFELGPGDRTTQIAASSFDAAIWEVWTCLCAGACLHFVDGPARADPGALPGWLADQGITVAFLPTPLAELVLTAESWPAGLRLRTLITGGDRLRVRPPETAPFRLVNAYGPTECTAIATAGPVAPAARVGAPDIGRPVANTAVHVLDRWGNAAPWGARGELCIGGDMVARGYRGLPGLTAERFVPDPFAVGPGARMYRTGDLARYRPDGTIEFCGRADDQVKVRGCRVELAEVEGALCAHPAVSGAAVVASAGAAGDTRLVGFVVGGGDPPEPGELRGWLARSLPDYMLPARFEPLAALPLTRHGKVDRDALRTLAAAARPAGAPGALAGAERQVADIFAAVLGTPVSGPDANFFQLGGDSLLGMRVVARASRTGLALSLQDLLRHQTVRALAEAATGRPAVPEAAAAPGPCPLTPIQRWLLEGSDGRSTAVSLFVVETPPDVRPHLLGRAVRAVVERHETLRTRFRRNRLGWRQEFAEREEHEVFDAVRDGSVESSIAELRAGLDVERGPLVRVRHVESAGRLVLLVHHLVCDGVSLSILLDDLDEVYADLVGGRPLVTSPQPNTLAAWARRLADHATSDELAGELPYWTSALEAGADWPSLGEGGGPHRAVARTLPAGGLGDDHALVVGGVALGLARWRGASTAFVTVEGRGVGGGYAALERSRAVGWFGSLHPLALRFADPRDAAACVGHVGRALDAVPNTGAGYGVLRHLSPPSPDIDRLRALREPETALFCLAPLQSVARGTDRFRPVADADRSGAAAAILERFRLAIQTQRSGDALHVGFSFHGGLPVPAVEELAGRVVEALAEVAACR